MNKTNIEHFFRGKKRENRLYSLLIILKKGETKREERKINAEENKELVGQKILKGHEYFLKK